MLQSGQNGPLLQDLPCQHFSDHPAGTVALCLQSRQDMPPSRPSMFSFWQSEIMNRAALLWRYKLWMYFSTRKETCYKKASSKKMNFLWPYFLKIIFNKWMRNSVIIVNVMKTPHIYKVQYRYIGQGKTWLVDILMGQGFIGCRRCTLTTSTVLTLSMSEWKSLCACVCTDREETRENKTEDNVSKTGIPQAEESSCYLDLLLSRFFKYIIPCRTVVKSHYL